jgi:hypothetical protein
VTATLTCRADSGGQAQEAWGKLPGRQPRGTESWAPQPTVFSVRGWTVLSLSTGKDLRKSGKQWSLPSTQPCAETPAQLCWTSNSPFSPRTAGTVCHDCIGQVPARHAGTHRGPIKEPSDKGHWSAGKPAGTAARPRFAFGGRVPQASAGLPGSSGTGHTSPSSPLSSSLSVVLLSQPTGTRPGGCRGRWRGSA